MSTWLKSSLHRIWLSQRLVPHQYDQDSVDCLPLSQCCAGQPCSCQAQWGEPGVGGVGEGPAGGPPHQHHQGHGHQPD